jgi:hypothetical protein
MLPVLKEVLKCHRVKHLAGYLCSPAVYFRLDSTSARGRYCRPDPMGRTDACSRCDGSIMCLFSDGPLLSLHYIYIYIIR